MTAEINELLQRERQLELKKIAGTTRNITINERTLEAYRDEYRKKSMVPEGEKDYPKDDYHLISKQKKFDALLDPKLGIRKIISNMVRQPITVFNSKGQPEIKDALYYNGYWYGTNKRGGDLGAPFQEGYFKRPTLYFPFRRQERTQKTIRSHCQRRNRHKHSQFE
jgi:hypothetical protein